MHSGRSCIADRRKVDYCYFCLLRTDGQFETHLRDGSQRALSANKQTSQLIIRSSLPRTMPGLDDTTICQNHGQVYNPIAHSPISKRVGTTCTCADHSTKFRGRARIHRKEQPRFMDLLVELHPLKTRLYNHIHILLVNG